MQHKKFNNKDVAIIFDVDVSELYQVEQKQKQQAQILEQINDSVITTDLNDIITHWNNGATVLHGYSEEEMLGRSVNMLYLPEEMKKIRFIKAQALEYGVWRDQVRKRNKQGDIIYTNLTVSVLKDDSDNIIGLTRYSQDRTRQKAIEDELKMQTELLNHQAYHDTLTELPNRALFEDRLEQSILNAQHHGECFALLFIDLDNFKQINDTLGHSLGDDVLKITAQRLSKCISENDTLARLGGDEFTIILQDMASQHIVAEIAERIARALKPKIRIGSHELHISASIGISLYPEDSETEEDLLKFADTAMYRAKENGKARFQFYSSDMTHLAVEKAMIESSLRKAIEAEEFTVFYQPQINANDGSIYGMEALLRWQHPEMGVILPERFIPLAEENNLIGKLGKFAMRRAMKDMRCWRDEGLNPGVLSLNLSIQQLLNPAYTVELSTTIAQTGFDLRWLELEITETQMMRDPMKSIETLNTLSAMGIEIAIDDFGTGYSSLAYLKRLPVSKLKIDKSFVMDLPHDEEDCAIIDAVMALAKSMKLTVIAEGVEKQEQSEYLRTLGCQLFQGFYYAKPMPADRVKSFLKAHVTP